MAKRPLASSSSAIQWGFYDPVIAARAKRLTCVVFEYGARGLSHGCAWWGFSDGGRGVIVVIAERVPLPYIIDS